VNTENTRSQIVTPWQLAALVDRHAARLVLYARQICSDPEDVVQDAFLEFIESLPYQKT
jgi:DNA-directed RNA polymerase specialized sigma24 family protein